MPRQWCGDDHQYSIIVVTDEDYIALKMNPEFQNESQQIPCKKSVGINWTIPMHPHGNSWTYEHEKAKQAKIKTMLDK